MVAEIDGEASAAKTEADAAAAETANEPEPAGNVSAETNGPKPDEYVSAETSGGETSLENLITLCRFHHRSLHREEYRIERGKNGTLVFMDARGSRMPSTVYPQFASDGSATETVQRLRAEHADQQSLGRRALRDRRG